MQPRKLEETCQTHTHTGPHCNTAQYTAISALDAVSRRLCINLARLVHTRLRILCRPRHVRTSAILSLLARPKILYIALSIQASSRQALVPDKVTCHMGIEKGLRYNTVTYNTAILFILLHSLASTLLLLKSGGTDTSMCHVSSALVRQLSSIISNAAPTRRVVERTNVWLTDRLVLVRSQISRRVPT